MAKADVAAAGFGLLRFLFKRHADIGTLSGTTSGALALKLRAQISSRILVKGGRGCLGLGGRACGESARAEPCGCNGFTTCSSAEAGSLSCQVPGSGS